MSKPKYADLHSLDEDARITIIGTAAMNGNTVAFVTDSTPGKADRYISKLKAKFPGIVVLSRFDGPVKGAVSIKVGPPVTNPN